MMLARHSWHSSSSRLLLHCLSSPSLPPSLCQSVQTSPSTPPSLPMLHINPPTSLQLALHFPVSPQHGLTLPSPSHSQDKGCFVKGQQ
ncbi:hypothetical protein Mapa_006307 [Marchantia paleacea]|nr:hypothetical protein Mapa_006307 [Marchantia paleacea]